MSYEKYDEGETWWDGIIIYGAITIWALIVGVAAGVIVGFGFY
jgi:hypothetical protein